MSVEDHLLSYTPANKMNFRWGDLDWEEVDQEITKSYDEIVQWHQNLFKIPSGKQGKTFASEMAGLFQSYADGSATEKISLKAAMVLLALLLQKPHLTSETKDYINCI